MIVHALFSESNGRVFADADGNLVHASGKSGEGENPVAVALFAGCPEHVFLVRSDGGRLNVEAEELSAPVLSYWRRDAAAAGAIHLRQPARRLFLSASPTRDGGISNLKCDRENAGAWETFRLVDEVGEAPAIGGAALLATVGRAFGGRLSADAVTEWLAREPGEHLRACAAAVLRALPPAVLRELASRSLSDGKLRTLLEAALLSPPPDFLERPATRNSCRFGSERGQVEEPG